MGLRTRRYALRLLVWYHIIDLNQQMLTPGKPKRKRRDERAESRSSTNSQASYEPTPAKKHRTCKETTNEVVRLTAAAEGSQRATRSMSNPA